MAPSGALKISRIGTWSINYHLIVDALEAAKAKKRTQNHWIWTPPEKFYHFRNFKSLYEAILPDKHWMTVIFCRKKTIILSIYY